MNTTPIRIIPIALVLALAACQQQPRPAPTQAPVATQQASPSVAAKAEAPAAQAPASSMAKPAATKPSTTAAKAAAPVKPSEPVAALVAPTPAKPATATAAPKPAAPSVKTEAVAATPFSTTRCMACHAVDHDKVGPAWKTVVEKYGDEATLAKDFETGFKARRVANAIAKWKPKEGLMTMQYRNLIKGRGKAAAHALFMTVKNGKFGTY